MPVKERQVSVFLSDKPSARANLNEKTSQNRI
jgi:hypothetical protein